MKRVGENPGNEVESVSQSVSQSVNQSVGLSGGEFVRQPDILSFWVTTHINSYSFFLKKLQVIIFPRAKFIIEMEYLHVNSRQHGSHVFFFVCFGNFVRLLRYVEHWRLTVLWTLLAL